MIIISLLIIFNAFTLFSLCLVASRRSRLGILSPVAVTSIGLCVMYVLRPIYILKQQMWGISPDYTHVLSRSVSTMSNAMVLTSLGIFVYAVVILAKYYKTVPVEKESKIIIIQIDQNIFRFVKFSFLALFIFLVCFYSIQIESYGGISHYFYLLGNRAYLIKDMLGSYGFYIILLFYLLESLGFIIIFQEISRTGSFNKLCFCISLTIVSMFSFLGGRSDILFFFISVVYGVIFIQNKITRRLKVLVGGGAIILLFGFGIVYRVVLRDVHMATNLNRDMSDLTSQSIFGFFDFLVGGYDFVQIDAMMVLLTRNADYLFGSTIVSSFLSFIPRAIWPGKPLGAMSEFTKHYFPFHYHVSGGGEFVVSWMGEMFMNFGEIGVLLGMATLALAVLYLDSFANNGKISLISIVLLAILVIRPFNILKADFFNNYMAIIKLSFVPVVIFVIEKLGNRFVMSRPYLTSSNIIDEKLKKTTAVKSK